MLDKKIIAHRGESYLAPENTLASVNLAWNLNDYAVEIDIHLTKDNQIVAIHDNNTKRTGKIDKEVKDLSLRELKNIDVGSFKSSTYKNEKIPTLIEILETVPQSKKLIIEIKSEKDIVKYLSNNLKNSKLHDYQIEIISFDFETISLAKKAMPQYKALWLLDLDYYWYTSFFKPNKSGILKKLRAKKLDGIDVWADKFATESFLKTFKENNFLFYLWTIDNPIIAKKYLDWGADAITTNRAHWMKEQLSAKMI